LAERDDPGPVRVIFISGKPDNFIVGVDIKDFLGLESAEQAAEASRLGQRIFGKIAELPFPSVEAINGTCLGGGLELALSCTGRIITDHPRTVLGLPEVKLGLLDEVGLDVAGKVSGVMDSFIGEPLEMADHNRLFTEDDRLGRKNGRGFYAYGNGKKGKVDDTVYRLFDNPRRRSIPYEEVRQRLLASILNEAAYVLDEGIIDSAAVGDAGGPSTALASRRSWAGRTGL